MISAVVDPGGGIVGALRGPAFGGFGGLRFAE
jgi:hypothetical protein